MTTQKHIADILAAAAIEAAAVFAPTIAANALQRVKEQIEDPTTRLIVGIMEAHVRKNGRDNIEALGADLADFLTRSKPVTAIAGHLNAAELTALTNVLQDAEAKRLKQYAKLSIGLAGFVQHVGRIVVDPAARKVLGDLS